MNLNLICVLPAGSSTKRILSNFISKFSIISNGRKPAFKNTGIISNCNSSAKLVLKQSCVVIALHIIVTSLTPAAAFAWRIALSTPQVIKVKDILSVPFGSFSGILSVRTLNH